VSNFVRLLDRVCVGSGVVHVVAEFTIHARVRRSASTSAPFEEWVIPARVLVSGMPGTGWQIDAPFVSMPSQAVFWQAGYLHLWRPATDPTDYTNCGVQVITLEPSEDVPPLTSGPPNEPAPSQLIDAGEIKVTRKCCDPVCVEPAPCPGCRQGDPSVCSCGGLPKTALLTWSMDACTWCHRRLVRASDGNIVQAEYWRLSWLAVPSSPSENCVEIDDGEVVQTVPNAIQIDYLELDLLSSSPPPPYDPAPSCADAFASNAVTATATVDLRLTFHFFHPSMWVRVEAVGLPVLALGLGMVSATSRDWTKMFAGGFPVGCEAVNDLLPLNLAFDAATPNRLGHVNADTCPGDGEYSRPFDPVNQPGVQTDEPDFTLASNLQVRVDWCCGEETDCDPPACLDQTTFTPDCPSGAGWLLDPATGLFPNPAYVWNCDSGVEAFVYDPVSGMIVRVFLNDLGGLEFETIQEPC